MAPSLLLSDFSAKLRCVAGAEDFENNLSHNNTCEILMERKQSCDCLLGEIPENATGNSSTELAETFAIDTPAR